MKRPVEFWGFGRCGRLTVDADEVFAVYEDHSVIGPKTVIVGKNGAAVSVMGKETEVRQALGDLLGKPQD